MTSENVANPYEAAYENIIVRQEGEWYRPTQSAQSSQCLEQVP